MMFHNGDIKTALVFDCNQSEMYLKDKIFSLINTKKTN